DREGADGPADVAIVGSEDEVARQIMALADCGVTDFAAGNYARGGEHTRTRALLKRLASQNNQPPALNRLTPICSPLNRSFDPKTPGYQRVVRGKSAHRGDPWSLRGPNCVGLGLIRAWGGRRRGVSRRGWLA